MQKLLVISPFLISLLLGLALGVVTMLRGIDRHLQRRGGARVSPLNMPTIAGLLAVTGAVGYPLARYSALSVVIVVLIALASGVAGAAGVFALLAGWAVPSAAADVEDPRYLLQGHPGRVTAEIAAGSVGEIVFEHGGAQRRIPARTATERAIPADTEIVIERVEDGVAYVELWATIASELRLPA